MKRPKDIQLINQPDDDSCVVACIAMITCMPFEMVRSLFKSVPVSVEDECKVLSTLGVYAEYNRKIANWTNSVYLLTVPSLNCPGGLHEIVLIIDSQGLCKILDPQSGREGKKFYTRFSQCNYSYAFRMLYTD